MEHEFVVNGKLHFAILGFDTNGKVQVKFLNDNRQLVWDWAGSELLTALVIQFESEQKSK